jgi:tetratricopeptide (TPR) repeat protein
MPEKQRVSPWLRGTLYVVAILFLPAFLILTFRPDVLDPKQPRPTMQSFKFGYLIKTGSLYERFNWHDSAIAKFQEAEQYAGQMTGADTQYESAQRVRYLLAQSYLAEGRSNEAEKTYGRIVQSGMDAGDAFRSQNQCDKAVPRYHDAERYSQKLTATKFASLQAARQNLAQCLSATNQNTELEQVDLDMIQTMQDSENPDRLKIGNTYIGVAFVRSHLQNWAGAQEALLQALDAFDDTTRQFSGRYDPENRALQAKSSRDVATWYLAVAYLNEGKADLALSTAESAYRIYSQPPVTQGILMQLILVGQKAASAQRDQEQIELWQQRLNDLTGTALEPATPMAVRIPDH